MSTQLYARIKPSSATQHGVGMCHSTEEGLRRMIDAKVGES